LHSSVNVVILGRNVWGVSVDVGVPYIYPDSPNVPPQNYNIYRRMHMLREVHFGHVTHMLIDWYCLLC